MSNFQIQVKHNYLTGTSTKSSYLDLYGEEGIDLTFNIADIRDVANRDTSYSKTVRLPGTSANNITFTHIFEINKETDGTYSFKPNKRADAVLIADTMVVMTGFLQLVKINVFDDLRLEYEVIFFGEYADLSKELGDKLLYGNESDSDNLQFPELVHDPTQPVVEGSWTGNADSPGFIYPIIDYGFGWNRTTLNNDKKIAPGTNCFPSLYVKRIWDKIMFNAGFTYESDFLNSAFFKSLFMPNNISVKAKVAEAASTTNQALTPGVVPVAFPAVSNYKTSIGNFGATTIGATTYYHFTPLVTRPYNVVLNMQGSTSGGLTFEIYTLLPGGVGTRVAGVGVSSSYLPTTLSSTVTLTAGTQYIIMYRTALGSISGSLDSGSNWGVFLDEIDMSQALPEMKQIDFVRNIVRMFYLYVEPDKDDPKKLHIEPRDDYYAKGKIVDWSQKMDKASDYELQILSEMVPKNFSFTYATDSDYLNKSYEETYKQRYGSLAKDIDNDFANGTSKVELGFVSTPMEAVSGYTDYKFIIPKIFKKDNSGKFSPTEPQPRILMNCGLVNFSGTIKFDYLGTTITQSHYPFVSPYEMPSVLGISSATARSLNFGNIRESIWDSGDLEHTLFDDYYSGLFADISSPDAKMLRGKFLLTPLDIYNMRFNDKIFLVVDGSPSYWRLNKIDGYDPTTVGLTTVELIKADDINRVIPKSRKYSPPIPYKDYTETFHGGGGDAFFTPPFRVGDNSIGPGTDMVNIAGNANEIGSGNYSGTVFGSNNLVGSDSYNYSILGNGNSIAQESHNVKIVGDNNTVDYGVTDVVIIGNNISATVSNKTYTETLQVNATFSVPHLNTAGRLAISQPGTIVFDTDLNQFFKYAESWSAL